MGQLSFTAAEINGFLTNVKQQLTARSGYTVGCYLFPGWLLTNGGGPNPSAPWDAITSDRYPILGTYDESLQHVNDWRFSLMDEYGIDFVAIDWFQQWSGSTLVPYLDHVANAHMACRGRKPKFCLQFANQTTNGVGITTTTWPTIVAKWIATYFFDPDYYRVNGKPVIVINSGPSFRLRFASNAEVHQMLDLARNMAIAAGLPGIHFMSGQGDSSSAWTDVCRVQDGWDGVTGSNIFRTVRQNKDKTGDNTPGASPTTYADLHNAIFQDEVGSGSTRTRGFMRGWLDAPNIGPVWVPATAGYQLTDAWNGGTPTSLLGQPALIEFYKLLAAVKSCIDANPDKTSRTVMFEAWNEFGEGGFLEPTVKWGYELLRAIRTMLVTN